MASHGRESRIPKKNKKFFLHRNDGSHSTHTAVTAIDSIPTVVTDVDSTSVGSDESVELERNTMSKKQRDVSIKNSRRMKIAGIEDPITHPGTDAPEHIRRLGFMNCKNTCSFPKESVDKFGISQFDSCRNCCECVNAGRITASEFYGDGYDDRSFGYDYYDDDYWPYGDDLTYIDDCLY